MVISARTQVMLVLGLLSIPASLGFDFLRQNKETDVRLVNLMTKEVPKFLGNRTHRDYFKLLKQDGLSVLVGARNMVYNLTLPHLKENEHEVQ
jgi:hypothetical protein